MTPQAIVKTAIDENLDVIALADHNEISNVQAAKAAAAQTSLYVVPGVELSTPQGHLFCYLPTFDVLQSFFDRLNFADRGTLALPKEVEHWSLTTLREKLVEIGAKVVRHGCYVTFQMAEIAVPRRLFQEILRLIDGLRRSPLVPAGTREWLRR